MNEKPPKKFSKFAFVCDGLAWGLLTFLVIVDFIAPTFIGSVARMLMRKD